MMKKLLAEIIGEMNFGRLKYFLGSKLGNTLGPFNGQAYRQRIVSDLVSHVPFQAIVETGTFAGTTTQYLAAFGVPVYTVDSNPRYHGYASARLAGQRALIHVCLGASPMFLRDLARNKDVPKSEVFFYLDAHSEEALPLAEEIEIIFNHWSGAVVMVDDFEVPGMNYGYINHGPQRVLNLAYLQPFKALGLSPFFPAADPRFETGKKRGCVVLCRAPSLKDILNRIPTLTRWTPAVESPADGSDCHGSSEQFPRS